MSMLSDVLSGTEQISLSLRSLYRLYGYTQFKMSKFEEYDLYANHKDFLVSDGVITFTDLSGKLMALKPDVTLSIVRNSRDGAGVQKLYYTENVYRADKGSRCYKEILQAGLECIGEVDEYCLSEVLTLAAESLRRISENCVLDISHMGIVSAMIDALALPEPLQKQLLAFLGAKNLHELTTLCEAAGAKAEAVQALRTLLQTRGTPAEVLPKLTELGCPPEAVGQLQRLTDNLAASGLGDMLRIDFSLINDMNYYNGIVFKGFVSGVPTGVLSGGQYDRLMEKMGRTSSAIGFAVYLDALERLGEARQEYDTDLLLLYDADADSGALCRAVKELTAQSIRVSAQTCVPEKFRYKKLARLDGNEVTDL